jgi:hypothetical protein
MPFHGVCRVVCCRALSCVVVCCRAVPCGACAQISKLVELPLLPEWSRDGTAAASHGTPLAAPRRSDEHPDTVGRRSFFSHVTKKGSDGAAGVALTPSAITATATDAGTLSGSVGSVR